MKDKKVEHADYPALYEKAKEQGVCHRPAGTAQGPARVCGAKSKYKCVECGAPMCGRRSHTNHCYVCHMIKPPVVAIVKG